jgi:hypothetical protein
MQVLRDTTADEGADRGHYAVLEKCISGLRCPGVFQEYNLTNMA